MAAGAETDLTHEPHRQVVITMDFLAPVFTDNATTLQTTDHLGQDTEAAMPPTVEQCAFALHEPARPESIHPHSLHVLSERHTTSVFPRRTPPCVVLHTTCQRYLESPPAGSSLTIRSITRPRTSDPRCAKPLELSVSELRISSAPTMRPP